MRTNGSPNLMYKFSFEFLNARITLIVFDKSSVKIFRYLTLNSIILNCHILNVEVFGVYVCFSIDIVDRDGVDQNHGETNASCEKPTRLFRRILFLI